MWAQIVFSDLNEAVKRSLSPGETMLTGEAGTLALYNGPDGCEEIRKTSLVNHKDSSLITSGFVLVVENRAGVEFILSTWTERLETKEDSPELSGEEDEAAALEFLNSCVYHEKGWKPIPSKLVELVSGLCQEKELKLATIWQSPNNYKHILLKIINPTYVDVSFKDIINKFEDFVISVDIQAEDDTKYEFHALRVNKEIKHRYKRDWCTMGKTASCELLVKAKSRSSCNNNGWLFFAVVPAHLVLTDQQLLQASEACQNLLYMLPEAMATNESNLQQPDEVVPEDYSEVINEEGECSIVAKLRLHVEQFTSRHMYSIQIDQKRIGLKPPALICYRDWLVRSHISLDGSQCPVIHLHKYNCPAHNFLCTETNTKTCYHVIANDIALLQI
ncbi:hypothetical protein EB796_015682 [Bugula neritina]|uniref:Uncharacterized protein n=1 Tax=Bugula neritina TaxID=10212 RepID=A0A7J7JIS3_BUGNE|nr:hypothetical protein EB796_015684 [Bugula neritina]KAF6026012.1 hypothetical protein EB796_015682 [Bugula neritina]